MSPNRKKGRKSASPKRNNSKQHVSKEGPSKSTFQAHKSPSSNDKEQHNNSQKLNLTKTNSSKQLAGQTHNKPITKLKWIATSTLAVISIFIGMLEVIPLEVKSVTGMLLIPAIAMSLNSFINQFLPIFNTGKGSATRSQIGFRNQQHGALTQSYKWVYSAIFAIGLMMLPVSFAMYVNKTRGFEVVITGIVIFLPTVIAKYYSDRLFAAKVSDLNYIKGTTTCREIAVYWAAVMLFAIYTVVTPGSLFPQETTKTVTQALSFVALARILSAGYKEYKEALSELNSMSSTADNSIGLPAPPFANTLEKTDSNPEFAPQKVHFQVPAVRINANHKLDEKCLHFVRCISAPSMTPGAGSRRHPVNKEPYGRARIPTAEGVIVVDGKILRIEDGPLVEFWRSLPWGRQLKVYLPVDWIESINRNESEWTHKYDLTGDS